MDILGRSLYSLPDPTQNFSNLGACLPREWTHVPQTFIDDLIRGMDRRCRACTLSEVITFRNNKTFTLNFSRLLSYFGVTLFNYLLNISFVYF